MKASIEKSDILRPESLALIIPSSKVNLKK